MKIKPIIFTSLVASLILASNVGASEKNVYEINLAVNNDEVRMLVESYAPISYLPGSPLYPFVLMKEDMEEAFRPNQIEKIKWKIVISNKRLKEAYELSKSDREPTAKNILAYVESLENLESSVKKLKNRGDMPIPVIDLENSLTSQQKILTYFFNQGYEMTSSNAIKANIELLKLIKQGG